jgi:PAS domain S-box-containing protein
MTVSSYNELKQRNIDLEILTSIIQAVHNSSDLEEIYRVALDSVMELENVDMVMIYLVDEGRREAVLRAQRNVPEDYIRRASRIPYPKGITWKVINTGRMLNVEDAQKDPDIGPAGRDLGHHSLLGIPIFLEEKVIGVIWFLSYKERKFDEREVSLLSTLGNQIAIAIAKAKLYSDLIQKNKHLKILTDIARTVHQSLDLKQIYEVVLDATKDLEFINLIAVYLVEGEGDKREAVLQFHRGCTEEYLKRASRVPYPMGVTWKVINSGEFNYYEDAPSPSTVVSPAGKALGQRALLSLPIKSNSETIGVIHFSSFEKTSFSQEEFELLISIGNQVATAIAKARLYEETKNQTSRIRESEYKYRTVVENANDGIIIVQDGLFRYLNNKAIEIFGYSSEEIYKIHFLDLIAPTYRKLVATNYKRRLGGENIPPYEVVAVKKDGGGVIINVSASLIEYEGRPAVIAILQDITEKKKSEEEVLRLAATVESLNTAVTITDMNRNIVYINPFHKKVFGYDPEELIGKHASILLPDDDPPDLSKSIYEATLRGGWEGERPSKRKNGEVFPSYKKTSLVRDKDGKAIAVVSVVEDLSERKNIEEQLIQSEKLASLGQLVSSIAHEINNPLTPILGYSQLLLRQPDLDERKKRFLEAICISADRVVKIIDKLLSFSRKHKPTREYVDINYLIEKSLEFRDYQLGLSNIEVVKGLEPGLPKTMADPNQLQQVFLNIILNAEQAMGKAHGKGQLIVRTRVKKEGVIEISFTDTGPGIPKEIIGKIFDPFFTTKPVGEGTGLGLPVAYGIIKEHGGRIYALSEEGKGATFIIELPILKEEPAIPKEERIPEIPKVKGKKILVVEDEELIINMIKGVLEEEEHRVDVASNGEEALAKIDTNSYDLIVCDIKMPYMNGKQFYNEVKAKNSVFAERFIFITGDPSDETVSFINETGNRFLEKPFQTGEFKNLINDVLLGL